MNLLSPIELGKLLYDNGGKGPLAARARNYVKKHPYKLRTAEKAYQMVFYPEKFNGFTNAHKAYYGYDEVPTEFNGANTPKANNNAGKAYFEYEENEAKPNGANTPRVFNNNADKAYFEYEENEGKPNGANTPSGGKRYRKSRTSKRRSSKRRTSKRRTCRR